MTDIGAIEAALSAVKGQKSPPVERWNPDFCGDIDMRIAVDGRWYYLGTPIGRDRLVRLFASVLRKDADGKTYLVTPVEKLGVTVEDAPFVATLAQRLGEGQGQILHFETNVGDHVIADADHPLRLEVDEDGAPRPYILVRGRLEALIARSVFYDLVAWAEPGDEAGPNAAGAGLGLWSSGRWFFLGSTV